MQDQPLPNGSIVDPVATQPFGPAAPGSTPVPTGAPLSSARMRVPGEKKSHGSIIETVILIAVTIVAVIFVYLYIQKYIEWENISTDVNAQIDSAVAMAQAETATKMEEEFAEREKYPYKTFAGPADYGSLSFEYPQTWSVYIARDAANGGDFEAYLNPGEVNPVSSKTINALRVTIRDTAFDSAVTQYDNYVKNGSLQFSTRTVGGVLANVYTGSLPNGIQGALVIFKLRDKTVMLQTDAELFIGEFYNLLDTVTVVP